MNSVYRFARLTTLIFIATAPLKVSAEEYLSGIEWKEPAIIRPGANGSAPSDAIVLFDGCDLSAWENSDNWRVKDGAMISGKGDIRTKESFGDCQLHIEWSAPVPATGTGHRDTAA